MKRVKTLISLFAAATFVFGCSSKKSSNSSTPTATSVTISGSLTAAGSSGSLSPLSAKSAQRKIIYKSVNSAFSVSDYKIACATFEDTPKACGADVDTAGAFSLTCDGYKGVPFGCFVFNKTTYKNYPIVFNVDAEGKSDESSLTSSTGITANIQLDLETGVASAEVTRAAGDTGTAVAIDAANLALINGTYSMAGVAWTDASKVLTDEQEQGFVGIKTWDEQTHQEVTSTTAQQGYEAATSQMGGGSVFFNTVADGSTLSAWPSAEAYASCGSKETGFTWQVSDGSTNQSFAFTGATSSALLSSISTGLDQAITTWMPFLNEIGGNNNSITPVVACKYAANLDWQFWNNSPEQISACSDDNNCSSLSRGDTFGALMNYKYQKLYSGAAGTDAILGTYDFSANIINTGSLKYGYMSGWDSANNMTTYTEISPTITDISQYKVDLGGCIQWSKDGTPPTIVAPGDYITRYMWENGTASEFKEKCNWSEFRYLYPDSSGNFAFNGSNYREIQFYIVDNSVEKQVWNKVCQITMDDSNGGTTDPVMYQMVPADMSNGNIATDVTNRMNGGSAEDMKGRKYGVMYRLIGEQDHGGGGSQDFYYCDRFSGQCGQLSASIILAGSGTQQTWNGPVTLSNADVWDAIGKVFDNAHDEWQLGSLLSTVMIAMGNDVYDARSGNPGGNVAGDHTSWKDLNNNGKPDIIDTLQTNSCLPKFQVTRICAEGGTCDMKVICTNVAAANGGCDDPEPSNRMAKMKVTAFGSGKYQFSQFDERYEVFYDPSTSTSKSCTRGEMMKISNITPLAGTVAAGSVLRLQFDRMESKVCDGETADPDVMPPMFFDFTKQ